MFRALRKIMRAILPFYVVTKVAEYLERKNHLRFDPAPVELTEDEKKLINYVTENNLTMVTKERLYATLMSCKYVLENNLEGDFVECGVWRGGNSILAAGMFKMYGSNKKVYLYNTFQGMTYPSDVDVILDRNNIYAKDIWKPGLSMALIEEVKANFSNCGLLSENVCFIQGDVLRTLEKTIPDKISILRLDTDFYESTKKEMDVLYKKIVPYGVFMVDDYGHCAGSKKAVDEYFEKNGPRPFLQYIDHTGRLGIKTKNDN